jgi:hypothetical protein
VGTLLNCRPLRPVCFGTRCCGVMILPVAPFSTLRIHARCWRLTSCNPSASLALRTLSLWGLCSVTAILNSLAAWKARRWGVRLSPPATPRQPNHTWPSDPMGCAAHSSCLPWTSLPHYKAQPVSCLALTELPSLPHWDPDHAWGIWAGPWGRSA